MSSLIKTTGVQLHASVAIAVISLFYLPVSAAAQITEARIVKLIGDSDDFRTHKAAFVKATADLLKSKQCSENDFKEHGGWVKSINHRNKPIYFTYCGGMHTSNRLYLDVSNGKTFR